STPSVPSGRIACRRQMTGTRQVPRWLKHEDVRRHGSGEQREQEECEPRCQRRHARRDPPCSLFHPSNAEYRETAVKMALTWECPIEIDKVFGDFSENSIQQSLNL